MNGTGLRNRELFVAIRGNCEQNDSMAMALLCYRMPGMLEWQLSA